MRASPSPADQPLTVTEYVEVIKEVARNETQQVQKQMTKPELLLAGAIVNIFEVRRSKSREVIKQIPKVEVQFVEKHVKRFPSCEQYPEQEELTPV